MPTQPEPAPSYVQGADAEPLLGLTIGQALAQAARRWPDGLALVAPTAGGGPAVRRTWPELLAEADGLAAGLLALGLARGERVGIWSLNNAEWLLCQLACARAGLVLATVNPAYRVTELEFALRQVGCAALVCATAFKSSDYLAMLREVAPELDGAEPGRLSCARLPALRVAIQLGSGGRPAPGMLAFEAVSGLGGEAEHQRLRVLDGEIQFDEAANIQFTSGTTGTPKGVTLTHHNILNNGHRVGVGIRLTERDRLCVPVPLYHCFGMVMGNLACLTHGAAMVYPGEGFDPLATLEAVARERCTALYGVPTMFLAELEHPRFAEFDLSSLRTGIMAGSICPMEVMLRVTERMNLRELTICYGMTETSPVSFQSAVDDALERRVSTVGRIGPHMEAKVVDGEGRVVPRGTAGELCVRGYAVMLGYWGQPERTAEVIDPARWMHTGDIATLDEEGYCQIVGRIKDLVIRGGENVYPREVEDFLYTHPAIADVQVFGVPDRMYGEELCAWVRLREGTSLDADELRAFCRGRIAHQKVPRHVRFVEGFPMTVTGKVQKFMMREAMTAELGG